MASWTYYEAGLTVTDEDDGDICTMNDMAFGDDWESMHATGRLIAAAPELLVALEAVKVVLGLLNKSGELVIGSSVWTLMNKATAKATGLGS